LCGCFAAGFLATRLPGCAPEAAAYTEGETAEGQPVVRVRVVEDATVVSLKATEPAVLAGVAGGAVRMRLPDVPVTITRTTGGFRIGDQIFAAEQGKTLVIEPRTPESLSIDGRRFRGVFHLVPRDDGRFDVVNHVGTDDYLKGVLPKEILPDWDMATHRAQAIVARTYALFELRTAGRGRGHFDLHDDTRSQVYGGFDGETAKARRAVEETRGVVVAHPTAAGWRIFKAYFHSTSGGVTLGGDTVFGEAPTPALSPQNLGDLGIESGRFHWDPVLIKKDELTRRMRAWGERTNHPVRDMSRIDTLRVQNVNAFGRPTMYVATDTRGRRWELTAEQARWSSGFDRGDADPVYSGWFVPVNNEASIVLARGRGWGHGVGMCQWSAQGMAERGDDFATIVRRSYPGTAILRAY
jgi:stage II sporulation protein D